MMKGRNGSLLTMTYLGAVRTMPNYNIMGMAKASLEAAVRYGGQPGAEGTRVNAISAGPIKTLAASGIGSFGKLLAFNEHNAPLRRNVTIDEVGNTAAFLCSDLASGVTGEIMYVDAGFNITALGNPTRPEVFPPQKALGNKAFVARGAFRPTSTAARKREERRPTRRPLRPAEDAATWHSRRGGSAAQALHAAHQRHNGGAGQHANPAPAAALISGAARLPRVLA
jgi:hypothetical protein